MQLDKVQMYRGLNSVENMAVRLSKEEKKKVIKRVTEKEDPLFIIAWCVTLFGIGLIAISWLPYSGWL